MDAAHTSFAPDKAIMLIDPADEASASFWREQNPEALAMAEGNFKMHPVILQKVPAPGCTASVCCSPVIPGRFRLPKQSLLLCAVMVTPVQPAGFGSIP